MIRCLSSFMERSGFPPAINFKVITGGVRCILLMYSDNQIRTLKFDDIGLAVRENRSFQKAYNFSFDSQSVVKSIITSSMNTFGLLSDGSIFYFVSFRAVDIIPNLKNVRAICGSEQGFVLIRNSGPVDVFIEFYSDRASNEMLKKYKKIPIGWEGEKWHFDRDNEKSVLQLVRLDCDPVAELFLKYMNNQDGERFSKAVVFSVNCSLFCVFYENTKDVQSDVCSMGTYLSTVENIIIFKSGILCVILASGVIRIMYAQEGVDGVKDDSIFLGLDEIHAVEAVPECDFLYLSDSNQCVRVTFHINLDASEQKVSWTIQRIELCGIIGLGFISAINVVLCLSENNFVYAIDHKAEAGNAIAAEGGHEQLKDDVDVLKDNVTQLVDIHEKMLQETGLATGINVLMNPQTITDNCRVLLSFKCHANYDEEPAVVDQYLEQFYDICLEFQCETELKSIFESNKWSLNVAVDAFGDFPELQETIAIDDKVLRGRKVKLFRGESRTTTTIGANVKIHIQRLLNSAEKLLIDVPLRVAFDVSSIVEVLEEDPLEMKGKWRFVIKSENKMILCQLLDLITEHRIPLEPFVVGIGRSAIIVNLEANSCTFLSNDQSALQLLKKLLLLEGFNRGVWTRIAYEPKETVTLCELSARHALFGDDGAVQESFQEIYKDLRDCVIKLS